VSGAMVASGSSSRALKRGVSQRTRDGLALGRRIGRMCAKGAANGRIRAGWSCPSRGKAHYRVGRQAIADEAGAITTAMR
jgi:hypothetical protein